MEIPDGTPDNTVWIAMTILTQIQNQPFVSHTFLTFQIDTRQSLAASIAEKLAATNRKLQLDELFGGRRVFLSTVKSKRSSSTPGLPRCVLQTGSNADMKQPRLLPTTAAATKIAHPNVEHGQIHVSRPLHPNCHVRFTTICCRRIRLQEITT